jgi:hypothetical protein
MTLVRTLHYFIVADRSGSMADQIDEVRSELHKHVLKLKEISSGFHTQVKFHFLMFNEDMVWLSNGESILDFDTELLSRYKPDGMTALFDAVGMAIERAEYKIGTAIDPDLEEVVIMAFSDGCENASHKWNGRSLTKLIESRQNLPGWTITFTGCDMAGFNDMASANFRHDRMMSYKSTEKGKAFRTMSKFVEDNLQSDSRIFEAPFEKE